MIRGFAVAAVLLGGCAGVVNESMLRDRASFDLSCAKDQLKISDLGESKAAGVEGCGKKATYVYVYEQSLWVKNAETSEAGTK
jgi:hypothetical protein